MKAPINIRTLPSIWSSLLVLRAALPLVLFVQMMPLAYCGQYAALPNSLAFVTPTPHTKSPSMLHKQINPFNKDAIRRVNAPLMAIDPTTASNGIDHSNLFLATSDAPTSQLSGIVSEAEVVQNLQIEQLSPTTTIIVFIIGIIPFVWATYEFWRRIAVGASFGTGSDSVVIPSPFEEDDGGLITIGEDDDPNSSRGRRTLDRGALTVAYVLFAVAGGSVAIAVASVVMGPQASPL
eukprot:CAMPEP_0181094854 /NCGR_PEP_ID=MMETSP1071-20121207/10210_1 /TAXON_ID=35127 /ORGANISM="Thalassiosira sp., Strain NH16" /LENGTH=235 /DNA_ID=CAMNT_0023177201 /DNA_START=170 /DNA_END=877 /DNA_ORIENTATION=-